MKDRTAREQVARLDVQVALLQERLEKFGSQIEALGARQDDVEKPLRDLQMEWEDWFEKFRNLYARINKRRQREEAEPEQEPDSPSPRAINPLAQRLLRIGGVEE